MSLIVIICDLQLFAACLCLMGAFAEFNLQAICLPN